ncbi:MAG: UDP-3-O-[3-hydroxymyristoyl] N-acetylglucosamine deacetylase, partial [Moraxella sp.]|nr:UDP-3-O-[3-hydroxymyristoyl] N-acetylglucosamine deacetylase [Moraxella sp.]
GQFSAYKSGHALNNQLIRAVLNDPESFEIVTNYDKYHCPISYYPADFPIIE